MQKVEATHPAGTLLQKRYIIEGLLGRGGFSAVYVVRSQDEQEKRFALKELRNQSKEEAERFLFECEVLKRLDHPALPTVSHVFEDDNRTYMLMEYIEGPNLEVLRQRQVEQRFALSEVFTLLAPVVDAVAYLHTQTPPVLHRDIKPANIIVPVVGAKVMLVDFGTAKEYHPDATTTAIRHCSPGYGAPEQYSGVGTDQRTDIYGLAATCYTLLTGTIPVDALQRATTMAVKRQDPLIPANERVSSISIAVADVLRRAMAIGNEQRFATVEEFWQALKSASEAPQLAENISLPTTLTERISVRRNIKPQRRTSRLTGFRLLAIVLLLLILGVASGIFVAGRSAHNNVASKLQTHISVKVPQTPSTLYPAIGSRYAGTIDNLLTHITTTMTLTHVQQNNAVISGDFEGLQRKSSFSGVLDTSKHIIFSVAAQAGSAPLFFQGSLRADGNLVGNYCRQDQSGQCVGDYGIWSIAPA